MKLTLTALALFLTGTAASAAAPTLAQLRQGHRVVILSAPAGNTDLAAQRKTLASWSREGQDRDVAVVTLEGTKVDGASDAAAAIRKRYAMSDGGFAMALVGKDGHVAYRSAKPVDAMQLTKVIDAMPMRRDGQR